MSFREQFKRLKQDWDKFNAQHNILPGSQPQQQPAQYSYRPQPTPGGYYQPNYQPPPAPSQQQQQTYYNRPPPPGPPGQQYGTPPQQQQQQHQPLIQQTPPQQPINTIYWQACFEPGTPVAQEWDAKLGNDGWGNNELENYTANAENAFFTQDHKLILRAITNSSHPDPAQRYTSARLVSRQRLDRDRGVLSAYITSPCANGIWPAFWLLPFEPFSWPTDGEIDIAETWNGDRQNHSCLHWGRYDGQDWNKHIVCGTQINDMAERPIKYEFGWDQPSGRLIWWIDGRPVMKAMIPQGTRPMRDFTILFNVAIGGNVCQGQIPRDGAYDMVVHYCALSAEPEGGWDRFEQSWATAPDGKVGV